MTGTRSAPNTTTDPAGLTGAAYAQRIKDEIDALWSQTVNQTGTVGGTANAITAVCAPPLIADPVNGQTFRLTPGADNTSTVTINLDGRGAVALRDEAGGVLAAGDLVNGKPVTFWYDAANGYYRLGLITLVDILAALTAQIAASAVWEVVGDTTVSGAVSQIEHTFTAGRYSRLMVCLSGMLAANGSQSVKLGLRHASGEIASTSFDGSSNYNEGSIPLNARAEILLGTVGSTKRHAIHAMGLHADEQFFNSAASVGSSATAPDRVRFNYSSLNITAGRVTTYGLKLP